MKKFISISLMLLVALTCLSVNLKPKPEPAPELDEDALAIARLLYSARSEDRIGLRTLCWCVFNRVDHPGHPNSIAAVVDELCPFPTAGGLESMPPHLYRIAQEELAHWREHPRTVSLELVYPLRVNGALVLSDRRWLGDEAATWRFGC